MSDDHEAPNSDILKPEYLPDGAGFEIGDSAFPMGEMAASLIHEPGTGGDDETERATIVGGPHEGAYRLHKAIEYPEPTVMDEQERERLDPDHCGYVAEEPVETEDPLADLKAAMQARDERDAAQRALTMTTQQRDILSRQVDSLVQRLAGLHVAHGTMDMAAAQGFVQKEILPINQVLQQIAASAESIDDRKAA